MVKKFKPNKAFLFRTKSKARKKARKLREQGYRAIVEKSSKTTRKRSPHLKWVVFRGQKRKR